MPISLAIGSDTIIKRAYEELDKFGWSEEELLEYDAVVKREMDHKAILDKKYNDGEAKGKAEEKIEMTTKMLRKGMEVELIAELSGLPIEEINLLKHKLAKQ